MKILGDQERIVVQPLKICTLMPLTLDRIGKREVPEKERPARITSLEEAFESFRPKVEFSAMVGSPARRVAVDFEFRSVGDFDPSRLQERQTKITADGETIYADNELAVISDEINALATLVRYWQAPSIIELWTDTEKRKGLLATLTETREHWRALEAIAPQVDQLLPSFRRWFPVRTLPMAYLAEVGGEIQQAPSRDEAIRILETRIHSLESVRDEALRQLFDLIRPIERSYRLLQLFFENARDATRDWGRPIELHVFNIDTAGSSDNPVDEELERFIEFTKVDELERFIAEHNDNLNFRDDISALVCQEFLTPGLRGGVERLTAKYGVILISDLGDVVSGENLRHELQVGGRYSFARLAETYSSQHVLVAGELRLRPAHWFENWVSTAALTAPSALIFSAAWARDERVPQAADEPCVWRTTGVPESIPGLTGSVLDHCRLERQVVATALALDGSPIFHGCRPAADDASGILRFPVVYRVERYLRRVAGSLFTQLPRFFWREDVVALFESPLERLLDGLEEAGVIDGYNLLVDKNRHKLANGIFDVTLSIRVPGGGDAALEII